jgi:subtilase family serine protease
LILSVRRILGLLLAMIGAATLAATAAAAPVRPMLTAGAFVPMAGASNPCQNGGLPCYSPSEIQQAYNFPTGPGAPTGAGQTIVVVASYGAPFVRNDLNTFGMAMGIPYPPNLTIVNQAASVPGTEGSGATYTWEIETDLDVEWAYAMAPRARIVLAVAKSDDTADVAQLLSEVLPKYPGAIVTQSFGMDETGPASDPNLAQELDPLYLGILRSGGTVLASAGDFGASNATELEAMEAPPGVEFTPSAMAAYPASDPLVLAVGGTMGDPYPDGLLTDAGTYGGEQVWNEISPFNGFPGATGGAPSVVFDAPPWQRSLHTKDRLEPDVSYNAALVDGAVVVASCRPAGPGSVVLDPACVDSSRQGFISVAGTSAGTPQWAAIVALANELRARQVRPPLGLVSPLLYELAKDRRAYARDFHDVTVGSNALDFTAIGGPVSDFGFSAGPGYDLPTGLGTPNVSNLLADLATRGSGEIPGNLFHGNKGGGKDKGKGPKHHRFDPSR